MHQCNQCRQLSPNLINDFLYFSLDQFVDSICEFVILQQNLSCSWFVHHKKNIFFMVERMSSGVSRSEERSCCVVWWHAVLLTLDAIKCRSMPLMFAWCILTRTWPLCVQHSNVFLVLQGEVCCGQEVCGEMLGPRVRCKVHEEETERPRLPDGDHPWNRGAWVGHGQPTSGQPPPGLRDGFWDGAGPGVVSIQPAQHAKTLTQAWNMNALFYTAIEEFTCQFLIRSISEEP